MEVVGKGLDFVSKKRQSLQIIHSPTPMGIKKLGNPIYLVCLEGGNISREEQVEFMDTSVSPYEGQMPVLSAILEFEN